MTVAEYNALQDRIAEVKKRIAALKLQMSQGVSALREVYGMDLPTPETTPNSTPNDTSSTPSPTPGVMAAHEQQPSVRNRTQLSPDEEQAFQSWYAEKAKIAGIDPDPDNPLHKYDYRGAFKAGIEPGISPEDGLYHWPSQFKDDDHPNRFVNGVDTKAESATPAVNPKANVNPFQDNFTPSTNIKPMAEIASDISPAGKENLGMGERLARGAAAIAPGLAAAAEGVATKPIDTAVGFGKAVGEHALETSAMMSASPVSPTFPTRMILKGAEKLNVPILRDIERKLQGLEDQRIKRYKEDPIQAPLDVLGIIGAPATAAWAIKASRIIKSVPKNIAEVMAKNATEAKAATGKAAVQRERAFFELASEADPTITREETKQWIDAINEYDAETKSSTQSLTKPTDIPADMQRMRTELESEMKTQAQKSPDVPLVKKQILKTKKSENLPVAEKPSTPQTITENLSQPIAKPVGDVTAKATPEVPTTEIITRKVTGGKTEFIASEGSVAEKAINFARKNPGKINSQIQRLTDYLAGQSLGRDFNESAADFYARTGKTAMIEETKAARDFLKNNKDALVEKWAKEKYTSSEVTSTQPADAVGTSRLDKPAKAESATASAGEGGVKKQAKPLLRTKPTEKPITPVEAAAEVKTEAATTSLTDKSFKQQMRAEISEAMKSAPDRPSELESAIKQSKDSERRSARYSEPETGDLFTEYSPSGYKSTAAETRAATKTSLDELRKKHGIKTVTIEIPGDGTFKIEHTKQALEELNKRLNQKLETPEPKLQSEGFGGGSSDIGTGGLHEATINGHYVEVGDRSIRPSGTDGISTAKVDVYDDAAARKMGYITNNHYIVKTSAVSKQPKQVVIRGTELKTKELQDFLKQIDGVKFGDDATEVATFDINRGSASDATFNTVFHDGKITATFNSAYIKYLKDNVDGFSLRLSGESGQAAIMSNGKRVGVIMPTRNTDATVERLIAPPKKPLLKTKKPTETTGASAEATAVPEPPKPAKLSDKIKTIADKAEADAKARLKGKIDGLSSGTKLYDITGAAGDAASMGKDLAIIGAAKIARGAVEFAQWSKAMVDDLGESIRPHLEAIYKRANDEFESMKTTTIDEDYIGLNKNQIAKIRTATGLDDLPEPDRARHIDVLNRAKKNGTDKKAMDIARDVKERPRPLTNEEHAGMVLKTEQLYSDWREATQAASDIIERGGNADDALVRVKALERDLDLLTEASDLGGREAARSLSIRRMLKAFETDDIIHVRRQATATKGSKLTPEESSQFEKLVAEKDAAIKRLDEANAKWQKDYDELQSKQAAALVEHEANRAKITEKIKVKREKIDAERVDILKQLRERGFETKLNAGLDPQDAFLIGKLGMNYVKGGITNVEEIVRLVMEDVPNLTRRDVLQSFNSKNPDLQAKAKAAAMIQVNRIKKQAELLVKIEDAENGIFSKTRKVLNTTPAEIKALQTKLRELRLASYETIRDADRLERIHKTITDAQNQLQGHYRNIKAKKPVDNEAVAELRGKLKDLRRQMTIEDELARLEDQLATGDFEIPTELKPRPKSELLDRAEIDLKRARRVIRDEMEKLRPKSPGEKLLRTSENLRAIKATADLSATLRQGAISVVSHPIKAAQNFVPSLKAAFSQYKAEQIDMAMRSSDAQYLRDKAKLELTNIDGTPKTREEHFAGVWIEKIPALGEVVKASNRHMATFLNLMRTSMFDDFVKKVPNATTEELQAYARWINVTTGRGELGKYAQAGRSLGTVFFAPRFAISRIQTPYVFYKSMKSSPRVRAQVAKEAVAVASTAMGVLALAKMSGAEVGTDPRESDFGKIRLGNERIDIFAGFQQPMRLIVRTGLYGTDKMGLTGDWLVNEDTGSLYSDAEFDPVEGWMRFAEFKLSPMITLPRELITGKTAVGEKTETIESLIRASAPMLVESMVEAWRDEGAGTAIRSGALNFMGVSSNVYADSQGRLRRDIRKAEYFGDAKTEDAKRDELTALKEKKKQEDQNKSGKITLNRKAI